MSKLAQKPWPTIIWVAAKPPIPPFSGPTLKALNGIRVLSSVTKVEVVSFESTHRLEEVTAACRAFWRGQPVTFHILAHGHRVGAVRAALARRFQSGTMVEGSRLRETLASLSWESLTSLVLFDDIVFAPLMHRYGRNALLSPHDCMSQMFWSHYRLSTSPQVALKLYLQYLIARHYEERFYHLPLLVHVVTNRDRVWLESINAGARYHVAPHADPGDLSWETTGVYSYDLLIWANLGIDAIARSVRRFLRIAEEDAEWMSKTRTILVGRVSAEEAKSILSDSLSLIEYAPYLEDGEGRFRQARITLVPDLGGAGIKTRCSAVLASGGCLACLYPQMEGMELACDHGAINAATLEELLFKVKTSLREGSYTDIASRGRTILETDYGSHQVRKSWLDMIQRALVIRGFARSCHQQTGMNGVDIEGRV